MEQARNRTASRDAILRGVYEENKRIHDVPGSRPPRTARTYATGAGGVVLLVALLILAMNFVLRDAERTSAPAQATSSGTRAVVEGGSADLPISSDGEEPQPDREEADAIDVAGALAASPVPIAELFHLGVRTIVIDPGHGGRDPGALGAAGLMEKEITLDVARRLADRLSERRSLRVVLTRNGDHTMSLKERAEFANEQAADLFVSIHVNQFPEELVYALETYYFGRESNASALRLASLENENSDYSVTEFNRMIARIGDRVKLEESRRLAEYVQRSLFRNTRQLNEQVRNWGVKTAPFVVLVGAEAPGILAEIGVISNADEESRLNTPAYREKLALFLEEGIVTYLNELSDQEGSQNTAIENAGKEDVDE
jgi:N-acetylmuramoyl-L-alanine amidase